MKRITLLALFLTAALASLMAQVTTPQGFNYQAVVRNSSGQIVSNREVNLRLSIMQGSENGTMVFSYTDHVQTNQNGVLTVLVGGTPAYKAIDWSNGPYFLKSEIDINNGNNFELSTCQQLLSVPYAHHADVADHVSQAFNYDGLTLSTNGDTLFLSNGSFVILNPLVTSIPWDSVINHPTLLSQFINDLNLSDFNNDMNLSDFNNDLSLSNFNNDMTLSDFPNDINYTISNDTIFFGDNNHFVVLPHNLADSIEWSRVQHHPTKLSDFINDLYLSSFVNDMSLSDFVNNLNLSSFTNDMSLSDFENDLAFAVRGDTLFLNDTTFVILPHNLVDSLDWNKIYNEPTRLSQFINDLGLNDFNNDMSFTINGDTIFLGDNNHYVVLPHNLADSIDWSRVQNHPTLLSQFTNDLNLSDLNNDMSLSDFFNDMSLSDFKNDLAFAVRGDTLFLNDTTFVTLPHNLVDSLDWNKIFNEPTRLSQFINDLNMSDINNDMSFTISGDTIFLGDSNHFVVLPHNLADSIDWSRVQNHPTLLSQFTNDLNLSDLNNDMSLSDFFNDMSLSDFKNDLAFAVRGDTLFLNDTTFVTLPHNLVDSLDWNLIYNEPTKLSQFINDLGLSDFTNDISFTIHGDTIFFGDNNHFVVLPHNLADSIDWSRVQNHPTLLSQFTNDLNLSDLNNDMSLSDFFNDMSLSDFKNDLAFAVRGDTLFLNDTTFVTLPHNLVDSLDWNKIYNEPTKLSQFTNDLNLSDFNNDMSLSDFPNDLGYLTTETQGLSDVLAINNDASAGITNLPLPVNDRDAVNKKYADSIAALEAQRVFDSLNARLDSLTHALDSINAANNNNMDSMMAVVDSLSHPTVEGAKFGLFSVSDKRKVQFSQGNLQYNPRLDIFRFADNQYDCLTTENMWIGESYNGWIDLFGYGTSGWKGGRSCFRPYETNTNDAMYMINSTGTGDDLIGIYENADWGIYNRIINGANVYGIWRTLTYSEWTYVLNDRPNANNLKTLATVNNKRGLILLPDNWVMPAGLTILFTMTNYNDVTCNATMWQTLEDAGAIFLPAAGIRTSNTVTEHNAKGYYWSSSHNNVTSSRTLNIDSATGASMEETNCAKGCSVRLVRDY